MAKLTLREARNIITSGEAFDMQWVTANEKQKKGGRRIKESNLQICGSNHSDKVHGTFTVKSIAKKDAHLITVHWELVEMVNGIDVI